MRRRLRLRDFNVESLKGGQIKGKDRPLRAGGGGGGGRGVCVLSVRPSSQPKEEGGGGEEMLLPRLFSCLDFREFQVRVLHFFP